MGSDSCRHHECLGETLFTFRLPEIIHSDQGRAFERLLLHQTIEAFGIKKSCTSAYHPQGDGMVERFNRSRLQMLRTYMLKDDWERHLKWALFVY